MKVLMVCLGNICRSPLAHGLLRSKAEANALTIQVASSGTSSLHQGEAPDYRMQQTAKKHGLDISDLTSELFTFNDFTIYDRIYVMDRSNYANVCALASNEKQKEKVKLILNEIEPHSDAEVPDPYYGGDKGFETVYNLLDLATDKIIEKYTQHEK